MSVYGLTSSSMVPEANHQSVTCSSFLCLAQNISIVRLTQIYLLKPQFIKEPTSNSVSGIGAGDEDDTRFSPCERDVE